MKKVLVYIHGKGGNAGEAEHYANLFPNYETVGLDYRSEFPWDAKEEFNRFLDTFQDRNVSLIANSIGAFFAMHAFAGRTLEKAFFISPIVDMEQLILDMLRWADISEAELREKGCVETDFGETLSWEYLSWVRSHPVEWNVPTSVLYGTKDHLQARETIQTFAGKIGAELTVMENGEHWFHTAEQMHFLDDWVCGRDTDSPKQNSTLL